MKKNYDDYSCSDYDCDDINYSLVKLSYTYDIILKDLMQTKEREIELKEQIYTLNTIIDDYQSRETQLKKKIEDYEIKLRSFAKENKNFIKKIQSVEHQTKSSYYP